jgi:tetratricopeptide (TPR) repeat protein
MMIRLSIPPVLVLLVAASAAFAMSSEPRDPPPSNPSQSGVPGTSGTGTMSSTPRQEAEQSYALAYEEVARARKDIEDGKAKNAEKKFKRALERCEKAVAFDERYHEAWNLLGYTARKTGDYNKAFKAYERCLSIKPDYAPAREYLGEAWLEKGDAKKARDQMVWLERLGATVELKTLKTSYDAWVAAHPEAAVPPATAPMRADSASTTSGTAGH